MNKLEAVELVKKTWNFLSNEVNQIKQWVNLALFHLIEKNDLERLWIDTSDFEELDDFIHLQTYLYCKAKLLSQWELDNTNTEINSEVLFEILADTHNFLGRKFLFEHYIDEKYEDYKVFDTLNYTPLIDFIFREFYKDNSISIPELLNKISEISYNEHEIWLMFHLIAQQLWSSYTWTKQELLEEVTSIVVQSRDSNIGLSKREASRWKKSGRVTRILWEDLSFHNLKKNLHIYTYIPNILSNNFWEWSQVVNVFNWIAKSYRPSQLKVVDKNTKVAWKIYDDASKVSYFRDFILWCKEVSKNIKQMTWYNLVMKYWWKLKELFGEFKMESIITLKKKYKSDELDFIDVETYTETMKKYLYLIKILKNINASIITTPEGVWKRDQSQIYSHIRWKIKWKTIAPVINRSWPLLARVKFIDKVIKSSKILKLKTIWFILMYKVINKWIDIVWSTDTVKRYKINTSLRQWYNIEASPELFNFLVANSDKIHKIDLQINKVKRIRLLNKKKKELENKIQLSSKNNDQSWEKDISLIKLEVSQLEYETKDYNIQEDILSLKTDFLLLLEQSSQALNQNFK